TKHMHVTMRHFLMGRGSVIGDNTIAAFGDTSLTGDKPQRPHQGGDFGLRRVRGEIVKGDVFPFGDHQNMRRGASSDVIEREDMLVLIDFRARQFAAQNAGEDIVAIIGHYSPPLGRAQRFARARFSLMPEVPSRRTSSAATSAGDIPEAAHSTSRW